jgi:hypothetical protein
MTTRRQTDELMSLIVQFVLITFLETFQLLDDTQQHWHHIGIWRILGDYILLPIAVTTYLIRILRFKPTESPSK